MLLFASLYTKRMIRLEITGIFRGVPVRVNPRQRTIKALFRTYLDVVHIKRSDQKRLAIDRSIINANETVVRCVFYEIFALEMR